MKKATSFQKIFLTLVLGALVFSLLNTLPSCTVGSHLPRPLLIEKYGPLVKDPAGVFDLPEGFTYKIISQTGDLMSDGLLVPDRPDGMATFEGSRGRVILIRNHELMPSHPGPFGTDGALAANVPKEKIYDLGDGDSLICPGGTSTLVINEESLEVEKSFLSLAGTLNNCSGGPTPWGSWISSEEIFIPKGHDIYQKDHGYNFEVPATEEIGLVTPVPLKAMGRFRHEAVGVDPATSIVYQTEDVNDGLIYRFLPDHPGQLDKGGRLQALAVKGHKRFDTRNWEANTFPLNEPLEVEWIELDPADSPNDNLRFRGSLQGAAVFARGEGMWFKDGECYFACTNGGQKKLGQIFRYIPSPFEGTARESEQAGTLELFLQPDDSRLARSADNLTVAPWGDLILCEDNYRPFLFGVTPEGNIYKLGRNVGFDSELTGCVFSPSGRTLFVNIQMAGLTLAIQGPWEETEEVL
jgi:secreted PhoX family phosphatase